MPVVKQGGVDRGSLLLTEPGVQVAVHLRDLQVLLVLGEAGGEVAPGGGQPLAGGAPGRTEEEEGVALSHGLLEVLVSHLVDPVLHRQLSPSLATLSLRHSVINTERLPEEQLQTVPVSVPLVPLPLHSVHTEPRPVEDDGGEAGHLLSGAELGLQQTVGLPYDNLQ